MKNKILYVLLAIIVVGSLVAFAACEEEAPPEGAFEWPDQLIAMSARVGSTNQLNLVAWGSTLEAMTGTKVRVVAEGNQVLCGTWGYAGIIDFWLGNSIWTGAYVTEGRGPAATRDYGPGQTRMFWMNSDTAVGFAVRDDSDIQTPYDLKGKTIAVATGAPDWPWYIDALLAWGNLTHEDVTLVTFTVLTAAHRAVMEGRVDLSFGVPTDPVAHEVEAGPHGQRWIDLDPEKDPEGAARFAESLPGIYFKTNTIGVSSSIGVKMPWLIFWVNCRADVDPELIYQLCKWTDENFDAYKDKTPNMYSYSLETVKRVVDVLYYPLHEGTIRYLKEKGLWDEGNESRQQENLDLLNRYVEAYQEAIAMADDKGILADPKNKEWIELWENYKKQLGLPRY